MRSVTPTGSRSSETGRQFPPLAVVPDRALVDERAQQLHDEERIALGLAVEEGEELAPDVLPVERRLDPLLAARRA